MSRGNWKKILIKPEEHGAKKHKKGTPNKPTILSPMHIKPRASCVSTQKRLLQF